jgi:hypothetical protein
MEGVPANYRFQPKPYVADANRLLGQSNGKHYQRIPGNDQEHDGQVMVRLRKKRFVVLDYSFAPTEDDLKAATNFPNVRIVDKAGTGICIHIGVRFVNDSSSLLPSSSQSVVAFEKCGKVGVPVCLYDSDPTEQEPLYLRSGFCFSCQRNLNHERRSERKRPAQSKLDHSSNCSPDVIYCVGPKPKHFKVGNRAIQLKEDALIIHGTVPHMTPYSHHGSAPDLSSDLITATEEAYSDASRLVGSISGRPSIAHASFVGNGLDHYNSLMMPHPPSDVNTLYHKTFQSLSRSLVLLSQWKTAWDSTMAAATETLADQTLVDAVASAVVDAGVPSSPVPSGHDGNNMVSLLLDAAGHDKDVEFTNNLMHSDEVPPHHVHDASEFAV